MTTAKEDLEVQKLGQEIRQAERHARRPWVLQILVPAFLTSLASGAGGYVFADSTAEKSRSAIRADVIKQYFTVENEDAGKRKQMIRFILATLAKDDPELAVWARTEDGIVDGNMRRLEERKAELEEKKAALELEKAELDLRVQELSKGGCVTEPTTVAALNGKLRDTQVERERLVRLSVKEGPPRRAPVSAPSQRLTRETSRWAGWK
jgi:hypothetical protein